MSYKYYLVSIGASLLMTFGIIIPLLLDDQRIGAFNSILGSLIFGFPAIIVACSFGYMSFLSLYNKLSKSHLVKVLISGTISTILCAILSSLMLIFLTDFSAQYALMLFLTYSAAILIVGAISTGVYWFLTK